MSKKSISVKAAELLRNKKIRVAIAVAVNGGQVPAIAPPVPLSVRLKMEDRLERLQQPINLDPADYFDELNHFLPIRNMPKHVRMAIAGFKVDPVSFITEVKFVDRINAIRLYSQLAGDIPRDKSPVSPPRRSQFDLSKLTDEELREHMRLRKKAMVEEPG